MRGAAVSRLLFGASELEADLDGAAAGALARLLHRVYDPEIGLIRYIAEVPLQPNEPSVFLAIALLLTGLLLYKEVITWTKVLGVAICILGVYFINK